MSKTIELEGLTMRVKDMSTKDLRVNITDIPTNANPEDWNDNIVFKLIHNKPTKLLVFLRTMGHYWKSAEDADFGVMQNNLYVVKCSHSSDLDRILSEGPWNFENHLAQIDKWIPPTPVASIRFGPTPF